MGCCFFVVYSPSQALLFGTHRDRSTPGFPVLHCLLELAQTHVHRVGDAIQPSHPLPSPSPLALSLSQHQGLFQFFASGGQRIGVSASTSVLPMNIQDWSPLGWTSWIFLQSKGLSRVLSSTKSLTTISYCCFAVFLFQIRFGNTLKHRQS